MLNFHLKLPNMKFLQINGANWHDTPHSHEDVYQISVPLKGKLIATLDHREEVLRNGQSIITHPLSTHSHQFEEEFSSLMIIGFNRETLNHWLRDKYGLKEEAEFEYTQRISPNELHLHLKQWITNCLYYEENSSSFITEVEEHIFQYFSNVLHGSHHRSSSFSQALHVVSDQYINQVMEYMHTHYKENIQIAELAKIAQQSKFHFIRSFKKLTNYTPHQYFIFLRVEKGKELLRSTTKSITEISYELGFSSPSQFYRYFVRLVGCTPKQYRDEMTNTS